MKAQEARALLLMFSLPENCHQDLSVLASFRGDLVGMQVLGYTFYEENSMITIEQENAPLLAGAIN